MNEEFKIMVQERLHNKLMTYKNIPLIDVVVNSIQEELKEEILKIAEENDLCL